MAVEGLFFDSQAGDRVYNASDWETIFESLFNDGVIPSVGSEMAVSEKTPTDMSVNVDTGRAMVGGKMVTVSSAAENLTISNNGSGNPRKDLVVARIDYTNRVGVLAVKEGTPGTTPTAPTVQQDATLWEIALAEVYVANGAVQITDANITDVRTFSTSDASVPRGSIVMWSGSSSNIPAGWTLCNGTNGAPDLRDKFIVGAGAAYASGDQGGAATVALTAAQMPSHTHSGPSHTHSTPAHTHTATSANDTHGHGNDGSHTHTVPYKGAQASTHGHLAATGGGGNDNLAGAPSPGSSNTENQTTTSAGTHDHANDTHNHSITVNSGGSGTSGAAGTGNTGSAGSGEAHENLPPYYALALIMKI